MAREPQEIIKMQIGLMMTEIAILTSALEKANEKLKECKCQIVREPDKPTDIPPPEGKK